MVLWGDPGIGKTALGDGADQHAPDDRRVFEKWVRAHALPQLAAQRAPIVLLVAAGCPAWRIAEIVRVVSPRWCGGGTGTPGKGWPGCKPGHARPTGHVRAGGSTADRRGDGHRHAIVHNETAPPLSWNYEGPPPD